MYTRYILVTETPELIQKMDNLRHLCRDYGYVGCVANVRTHMDSRCSGRRSCEVRIPDLTLDRANPCPKDFKTYLEASYGCVKGNFDYIAECSA